MGAVFVVLLASCAGDDSPGRVEAPIIGGEVSGPMDDAVVALAVVSASGFSGSCSGVLVADNLVLTARHCVSRTESGGIRCTQTGEPVVGAGIVSDHPPENLLVIVGARPSPAPGVRGARVIAPPVTHLCNGDIAFVVLDGHLSSATIAPVRLDAGPVVGETITAVGYGVSDASGISRRRRSGVAVLGVGAGAIPFSEDEVGPAELYVGESVCTGDSGGPALADETGAVLGVASRGGNGAPYDPESDPRWTRCMDMPDPYRVHNIYTRLNAFASTAREAFAAAGAEPWLEGEPAPTAPGVDAGRDDAGPADAGSAPPVSDAASSDATSDAGTPTATEDAVVPSADSGVPRATRRDSGCCVGAGKRESSCATLVLFVIASLLVRRMRVG